MSAAASHPVSRISTEVPDRTNAATVGDMVNLIFSAIVMAISVKE
ncbi:MAG: hypothetical protein WCI45_00590 [Desulfuromonadales bacterium]